MNESEGRLMQKFLETSDEKAVRIALLDDHAVVRHGFMARLKEEADFQIIGSCATTKELMQMLREAAVDILLIDYALSVNDIQGPNLIRALRMRCPHSKILIASAHYNPSTVHMAMRAGAHGFVGKEKALSELVAAIRSLHAGCLYLHTGMAAQISFMLSEQTLSPTRQGCATLFNDVSLSSREREVLRYCLSGLSVTQISKKFDRSVKTISAQKRAAFRKLGVQNDMDFFRFQHQLEDL